ncbi:MAG: class II fumarate hydratase [Deltaproteobacteria bacterium]|nr:MAG: class II fumarate hydratase [Deltaproteobacteria bacterium]
MSAPRKETDSMGSMTVPSEALYGAQTARARDNFPISGIVFPRPFLRALGMVKEHAAKINRELGLIDERIALAVMDAAEEVIVGDLDDHFPLDVFQTGSGTSTNMNANEVIANRACQLLNEPLSSSTVHPNDHVNFGQSSNDVIPTVMHLAAAAEIKERLLPTLIELRKSLGAKAREFDDIVTIARTHLQDATPIRLGQVFGGYFRQVALVISELERTLDGLCELPLGGTAVGTGLNTHPEFAQRVIAGLAEVTDLPLREAKDHFAAQGGKEQVVAASGALKTTATALFKIANDIRFLASGPRCGLGELQLPAVQPGSSIMPGKVNPVMAESLMQVCAQVIGNDTTITLSGMSGNFELNVMMPVMAHNLLQSIDLLTSATEQFNERCLQGLEADRERCEGLIEESLAMCTALAPVIGYDQAATIAKRAHETGRTVREVAIAEDVLPEEELKSLLDPRPMTEAGIPGRTR